MSRKLALYAGLALLAALWLGPLPSAAPHSFAAHMTMHVGVLAIASPLLALGLARPLARFLDRPVFGSAVLASLVELVLVWGWHAPAAHAFARHQSLGLVAEQGSFLLAGLWLWGAALASSARGALAAGIFGLLLTSMHMTLLGALIALAPRELYGHGLPGGLAEQRLGGLLMLAAAGSVYLIGGLWRLARLLADDAVSKTDPRAVQPLR